MQYPNILSALKTLSSINPIINGGIIAPHHRVENKHLSAIGLSEIQIPDVSTVTKPCPRIKNWMGIIRDKCAEEQLKLSYEVNFIIGEDL